MFSEPLERLGLAYMVTGSVASIAYGEPRLTHDVDMVAEISSADTARLAAAFAPESFYCPPVEVMTVEARRERRGHFNIIHHETGFKADVFVAGEDPLHAWALARRRRIEIEGGRSFWLAPPEYVIIRKLEYFREGGSDKHLRDIRGMLAASAGLMDQQALDELLRKTGTTELWRMARAPIQG